MGVPLKDNEIIAYPLHKYLRKFHNPNFTGFKCGNPKYDEYIKNTATNDHESNIGKVWIFYHSKDRKIAGYVTLAMSQLHKNEHKKLGDLTSHGYIPGLLLGQMARDLQYEKRNLGSMMINWTVSQGVELMERIGCRLIILQSEDDKVKFYESHDFILIPPSKKKKNMMFYDLNWYQNT